MASPAQTARAFFEGNRSTGSPMEKCGLLRPEAPWRGLRLSFFRRQARRTWGPACRLLAIFIVFLGFTTQVHAVPPGTVISNTAQASFRAWGVESNAFSNTVDLTTTWIRTPSTIELLQYAPTLASAEPVGVPASQFSPDGSTGGATQPVGDVYPAGGGTAIDLSQPVPLAPAGIYHQGEPIFFRVIDPDQNIDPLTAESVWVVLSTTGGDSELLLITETGPDTGIFIGCVQSSGLGPVQPWDGRLSVTEGAALSARYTDREDPGDTAAMTVLVDPYGLVFDSTSGLPVDNAAVTLLVADTGQPATVYGDDGVSAFPATIASGGTFVDASGKVYAFPSGMYRFPFVAPGNYRLAVELPDGYAAPSAVATAALQSLPGAPFAIAEPGSRGEPFVLNPGPALRIDLPVDPTGTGLWLRKSANRDTAAIGDFIQYTLDLLNSSGGAAVNVSITDRLPPGFRYRRGSARMDGLAAADPVISADGRTLTFGLGDLPAGGTTQIRYVTEIGAGARPGSAKNRAAAAGTNGMRSNAATAVVKVTEDLFRSKNFVVGRVIADNCGDAPTENDGVPGVRIFMEDGSYVVTDEQGRYHFEGVSSGTRVVQLDLESLPEPYEPFACEDNSRLAGTPFSEFVELQGGTLWRADFHVRTKPPPTGEAGIEMRCGIEGGVPRFETRIDVSGIDLGNVRLSIILPDGLHYLPGTSRLSGEALTDPQIMDQVLIYRLDDVAAGRSPVIVFDTALNSQVQPGTLTTRGMLTFDTPGRQNQRSQAVETVLSTTEQRTIQIQDPVLVFFESFNDELLPEGRGVLDQMIDKIQSLHIGHLTVVGHSDNLPIRHNMRNLFKDNQALSEARAREVARYLAHRLQMESDQIFVTGKGEHQPIASNDTEEGRALNRRGEVMSFKINVIRNITPSKNEDRNVTATQGVREGSAKLADDDGTAGAKHESTQDFDIIDIEGLGPGFAWLMPAAGFNPPLPSLKIAIQHGPREKIELLRGAEPVSGFHFEGSKINRRGTAAVSYWRGVHLNDGPNVFTVVRKDAADREIERLQHTVRFAGPPVHAIFDPGASRLVANGKDAPVFAVRLTDKDGFPARPGMLGEFAVRPPFEAQTRIDALKKALPVVASQKPSYTVDADGIARIRLQPTSHSGEVVVRLNLNGKEQEIRAWLQSELREWILVGVAEGTAGYNTVSGNMEQLGASDVEEDFYQDGRLAFFAKGKIKGQWLLTAAYDSARDRKAEETRLFQTIDPDTYYTLYGDATVQQYEASSIRKLYLKIEREQFYALFGDYETGLTVTELSRYSRRFNGLKSEYNGDLFGFSLFAADTDQAYVRDEIQGNGTSGLYRLSRRSIVVNSEKVTIQIRDRFRSDIILSSRPFSRFVDYSIDYDAGTLFFKTPIYSRDDHFNPVFIVAEYESEDAADESYTFGGRGAFTLWNDRVQLGATVIHESPKNAEADLGGLDAAVNLGAGLKAKAEISATRREEAGEEIRGTAYLAEVSRTTAEFDGRLYYRELGEGFGLGQQNGSEAETRKAGLDAAWRFDQEWTLAGQAYRYDNLATGAQRDLGEAKMIYSGGLYSLNAGLRLAEDRFDDGTDKRSTQILAGVSRWFYNRRLQMRLAHEQSLGGDDGSVDFPTRTLMGADFKVSDPLTLFAEHEITRGETLDSQSTRIGFKSTPWTGGQLGSSLGRENSEDGQRLFANLGLFQSWRINDRWSMDGGLDRSETIRSDSHAPFDADVPTAAGSSEDFTAATLGMGYRAEWWSWTGRVENRWADSQDQFNLIGGIAGEVRPGLGLSAGIKLTRVDSEQGTDKTAGDIRLSLAYRPRNSAWIVFDRLDYKIDEQSDANGSTKARRIVNNFNANFKHRRLQLALQYGAKYVFDTIDGDSYSGYTDLTGLETRYDLTSRWDIGLQAGVLHSWNADQFDHRIGMSVGYTLVKNTWLSLGYNLSGFKDGDFSEADFTAKGPFVKFRIKFDQQTPRDLVDWFSRRTGA